MSLSHQELRRFYLAANRRWFNGSLPHDADVLFAPTDGCHATVEQDGSGNTTLTVDPKFAICTKLWKQGVLHEMAHVASGDWRHGKRFNEEIARMFRAGAYTGLL